MFRLREFDEVTSTNEVVKHALEEGEPEGLAVRARCQSGGYGRQGRTWASPEGGLYLSLLLRPHVPPAQLPTLSLVAGLAVREAAVALAGEGAYLYGDAVLAMHGLALANPRAVTVALPRRTRKKVPDWVRIVAPKGGGAPVRYEGIPSQSVANALRACAGSVMRDRLLDAIGDARARGLITAAEQRRLRKEIA